MNKFWHNFNKQFVSQTVKLFILSVVICMFGCMSNVKVAENKDLGERPVYCFRADFVLEDGVRTYSWNCYERFVTCSSALDVAKKYGSLANVKSLTECKRQ